MPAVAGGTFGRSCGVGFLAAAGLALVPVLPVGAAWRRLHCLGRLHAVRVAPRPGLPQGLLLFSIYAPLQTRQQQAERARFIEAIKEVVHGLDF